MAIKSDYISGTLTITQGSTAFTGTGTGWRSAEFKEGDTLIDITGATEYMGVIEAITGEATGTLTKAWEGPTLTNVPYRMRYQPDGARSTAQARNLIEILGNGNITAFALLNGGANLLPMFTGPGAMTLITKQALVSGAAYDIQVATLADRAAYDGQDQGYAVLVSNVGDGRAAIYSKLSATSGDWSEPAYVTGAVGPVVQIVAGVTTNLPSGQNATLVVRPINNGYALDFGIPRGLTGADGADGADGEVGATGPRGEGLQIGATGDLAGRAAYDNEEEGFSYVDVENGNLYFRMGAPGGWSDPIPFGKGDKGDPGDDGATIVTTNGVGNGTAGPYTLTEAPASVSATWASISGVTQYDFTLSGNQITFGIPVETGIAWQVKSSGVLSIITPADGSVGASKINSAEAAGIRTAINAAAKPATATAGNLAVFDANREVQDTGIAKSTTAQAQAGTNDTNYMTPLKTAQAILSLSPPTDVSDLYSSVSALALALADLQGSRFIMKGGVADPFDDESGVQLGTIAGNDSQTMALFHFDTSVTLDTAVGGPKTFAAFGTPTISTAQSKFGGASLSNPGGQSGLRMSTPHVDFQPGSGDFTVDCWFISSGGSGERYLFGDYDAGGAGASITAFINPDNRIGFAAITPAPAGILVTSTTVVQAGVWYHMAGVRTGNVLKLFVNGVQEGGDVAYTGPVRTQINPMGISSAGNYGAGLFGYMDEFRFSKGIARWTSNFTPPSFPYGTTTVVGSQNQVYNSTLDLYSPVTTSEAAITGATGTNIGNLTGYGGLAAAFDGNLSQTQATGAYRNSGANPANGYVGKTYAGVGGRRISKVVVYPSSDSTYNGTGGGGLNSGTVTIELYGKIGAAPTTDNDGTLLGTNSAANSVDSNRTVISSNPETLWDHVWIKMINQGRPEINISEVVFFQPGTSQNMSLLSIPYPTTSQPASARLVLQIDTALTIAANTDLQGQVSRDGGTTWATANLQLVNTVGTVKTYEDNAISLSGIGAGTSIVWRARTLTNRNIPISGVVTQWK